MKRAGELRLEYGKPSVFCRRARGELARSLAPAADRDDGLAAPLKREQYKVSIGRHPVKFGLCASFSVLFKHVFTYLYQDNIFLAVRSRQS